jgi:molybdenum ABC transporter molybdate-binding protein
MFSRKRRPGETRLAWLVFLASAGVLVALVAVMGWDVRRWFSKPEKPKPIVVYCAAALKAPLEEIAKEYEQAYGVPVQLQFGASQTLLANAEVARRGDLYLPADDSYLQLARDKGLLAEVLPLARMTAVLAVRKGNPLGIKSLDDLLKGEARLAQANPDAAAIGKVTRDVLRANQLWEKFEKRVTVTKGTVNDVANDVAVGAADAGVVWDVTVTQYPGLEAVEVPILAAHPSSVALGVLRTSEQPTAALRFARYVAARDRGLAKLGTMGYVPVEGDVWAEKPEVRLFAGAMLRPAIEETVVEFEKREGVKVTRVYNGCGILVAQMKTEGQQPDAYFACDVSFMEQVRDRFEPPVEVSANQLVILVPKANPYNIRTLKDLGKTREELAKTGADPGPAGLRVGVGHERQCALGVLTQETLEQAKLRDPVMRNVKTQLPTGDMLVNELRVGALDAVVAYVSNAAEAGDELKAYKVELPCALAVQPVAVGKTSGQKHLTQRLLDALQTAESRERFTRLGFSWKATK